MTKKSKEPTFEEALQELEEITRALEGGDLTLDDSIQSYEKGMELRKLCIGMLEKAEKKLEYLEKKEDGQLKKNTVDSDSANDTNTEQSNLF